MVIADATGLTDAQTVTLTALGAIGATKPTPNSLF